MSLDQVARALQLSAPSLGEKRVAGVTLDSRTVQPGDLYAALPGSTRHGASFAAAAYEAGAVAVLTDRAGAAILANQPQWRGAPLLVVPDPRAALGALAAAIYGEPSTRLQCFGITGTNGKTTTAYLLESGLRALGVATGLIGTVETRIGEVRLPSARTTPEAPDLHAILGVMCESGIEAVVMEVSSHALVQHRVDGVIYDVAVFTNLSQDHLDFHHDMESYYQAKATLFTPTHARRGVVCIDGSWGRRLAGEATIPVATVGTSAEAHWRIEPDREMDGSVIITGPAARVCIPTHLPGTFNIMNAAVAAVAIVTAGYAVPAVEAAMRHTPVVPGRMEVVKGEPGDPRCVVDFAHTPEAVSAALAALRPTTPGRLIAVVGAGGDRDRGKRELMGIAAAEWADDVVVTDDNPRSEDPATIRERVRAGAASVGRHRLLVGPSVGAAQLAEPVLVDSGQGRAADIAWAVARARQQQAANDHTVVILGKGHETGQDIAGVTFPFDDRMAVAAALAGTSYHPWGPISGVEPWSP